VPAAAAAAAEAALTAACPQLTTAAQVPAYPVYRRVSIADEQRVSWILSFECVDDRCRRQDGARITRSIMATEFRENCREKTCVWHCDSGS